ncbi:exodeoxyribonuclease V subunit gamma [Aeromicrobium sp. CTD01-1L150]|uniref:exodeoxyribonuclease V subunit gamma n=1 Tax=Aeromicrobium sp. CTD01-1L150 TaxID=3341830 RepID=UPI0035C2504C
MPLTIHRAERADALLDGLAGLLEQPPQDPFERDVVVVGASGVERWLAQSLSHRLGATDGRQDGICAGVDLVRPAHLLTGLTGAEGNARELDDPWAPGRLAWTVLDVLEHAIDEDWLSVVATHVGHGLPERDEALRRSRRYTTARRTASLLHGYAVQRPWMVQGWLDGDDTDGEGHELPAACRWQAEVWRRAVHRLQAHPSPDQRLAATAEALREDPSRFALPARLSFFGHTRMAAAELDVVDALARGRDVHLWLPQAARRKQSEDGNALLASCGRDAAELDESLLRLPSNPQLEHLGAPERPATLLGHLQRDIAADAPGGDRALDPADRSVQVHACHGPARQVDVLREVVLGLLEDDPTLEPRDILIMCPDVETFAPLVQAAFGLDDVDGAEHPGHQLRVRLADRAASAVNPVAEVLQRVLAIAAAGRTSAAEVRDLLALAPVRRRFGLSEDDLEQLEDWTAATAVRWGVDADARSTWGLGGLAQNTWEVGLDRLALGVVTEPGSGNRLGGILPLDDLASTGVDLVGRVHEAMARLADLLGAAHTRPLGEWVELLSRSVDALTDVAPRNAWQREQVLRRLARLDVDADGQLTVVEMAAVLEDVFAARPTRTSFRTGSLTVCTMVPMRSVPHRAVCLLGLDADVFPRTPTPLGDDVLARHRLAGERDAASEDRQLFLDALMSATEHLVITYTGASEHTGRPLPAATPVGEMLDQLERSVRGDVRAHVITRHPLQAFDARSFTPGALVPERPFSFDVAALAGARATVRPAVPQPGFLPQRLEPHSDTVVTLDDLRSFLRHPVRFFVQGRLDVRLPYESDPQDEGIPLALDHLQQWQLHQRILASVLAGVTGPQAEADERRRGLLPPGVLADGALASSRELVGRLFEVAAPLRTGTAASIDVDVTLPDGRRVVGTVGDVHPGVLVAVTPSTLKGRQLLLPWVDVLALAATGEGRPARLVGRVRRGRGAAPGTVNIAAPEQQEAVALLAELLDLWSAGTSMALPLPVKTSQVVAEQLREHDLVTAEDAARWEWGGNRNRGIDGEDVDPYHVLAFGSGCTVSDLMVRGMDRDAMRLWTPLLDRLGRA